MRVMVTGGGTGGHVAPALATIQMLRRQASESGADTPVFQYVGSADGIEAKLAGEDGIDFVAVASGKLRRSSRGPLGLLTLKNLRDLLQLPVGLFQAFHAVRRFRPDVALATGGYVSIPPVIAAWLLRVPILTHEQTVTVGLANRIAGVFATRIALSFDGAIDDLPKALRRKTLVTGNPVRDVIFLGSRHSATSRFGFDSADDSIPTLYVTGGAQGSSLINRAIEGALPFLLAECRIVHQCGRQPKAGEQDFDRLTALSATFTILDRRRYFVTQFVDSDSIGDAYAIADLILGRSGAGTVTEACALGKPAVFVPLEPTGGNEQVRNAMRSVGAGAAIVLGQAQCDASNVLATVTTLLKNAEKRLVMGNAALALARPDAASQIAQALTDLAGAKTK